MRVSMDHPLAHARSLAISSPVGDVLGRSRNSTLPEVVLRSWRCRDPIEDDPCPWPRGRPLSDDDSRAVGTVSRSMLRLSSSCTSDAALRRCRPPRRLAFDGLELSQQRALMLDRDLGLGGRCARRFPRCERCGGGELGVPGSPIDWAAITTTASPMQNHSCP